MKKIIAAVVTICLIITAYPLSLFEVEASSVFGYNYNSSGEIIIADYYGDGGDIIIPEKIGARKVVGISDKAFYDNDTITSVTIDNGVTKEIGPYAFAECYRLKFVYLGDCVETISHHAFYNSPVFEIELTKNTAYIGSYAFSSDKVTASRVNYFGDETNKQNLTIEPGNRFFYTAKWYYYCFGEHVYSSDCDCFCNICGYARNSPGYHIRAAICSPYCYKCGGAMGSSTTKHSYSSKCDSQCDVCGYIREITHTYDNSCDVSCNICGDIREINHTYDNNCDVNCNICGEERFVDGHEFVFNNNWSCSCKFSKKPDAPQVLNKTATSITLIDYEGLEYSIDGEQWQSDVEFSNLLPDTEYTFYQRVAASGISYVSESSDALIAKTSTGYKISYDSNGGTANIAPQYKTYGISITLSSQTPTRSGYKFRGWALSPEGPVVYKPGNKYTEDSNVTLYARWIQLCDNCSGNGKISTCYQCNGWYSGCAICSGFGHRECAYCEGEGVIIDIESIALSQFPKSITYSERQNTLLVDGGLITLYYTDDSISVKTLKADMISGYDRNKSGVQELTIKYEWYTTTYQTEIKLAQTFVPTAPTLLRKNHNSVTLMAVVGYEYSCDGTNWQASNAFVGLEPETTYTFYQRMAETDRYYIGPASPALTVKTNEQPQYTPGDIDDAPGVTDRDAVHLLYYTFLPDLYPINQDCDFNNDGEVNDKDAVYLLYYTFLPDLYPIN